MSYEKCLFVDIFFAWSSNYKMNSEDKFSIVSGESSTCTICPNNSKQKDKCAGYRTLVNNL